MTKRMPPVREQRHRAERAEIRKQVVDQVTKATWRKASKAIADQAITHQRETAVLAANYVAMKEALGKSVSLIVYLRHNSADMWTPADQAQLEEWCELVK